MTIQVNRTGVQLGRNLSDTIEFKFDAVNQVTKLDPPEASIVQLENKYITDAGVLCYAKWFGFKDESLKEEALTDELRAVVTYAYKAMRTQEDKESEEKAKIPYPTWWQTKLSGKPQWIRVLLAADTRYFDTDKDKLDSNKLMGRQLRDGLGINRNASNREVYNEILKRI